MKNKNSTLSVNSELGQLNWWGAGTRIATESVATFCACSAHYVNEETVWHDVIAAVRPFILPSSLDFKYNYVHHRNVNENGKKIFIYIRSVNRVSTPSGENVAICTLYSLIIICIFKSALTHMLLWKSWFYYGWSRKTKLWLRRAMLIENNYIFSIYSLVNSLVLGRNIDMQVNLRVQYNSWDCQSVEFQLARS